MRQMGATLRGIATVSLWAANHQAAVDWYSELLGTKAYFERPGYTEFRIGDYQTEVGIIDSKYAPNVASPTGAAGVVVYWHVDDVQTTLERILTMGATQLEAPQDRGNGFVTATAVDPFGNILGIMHNPHDVEVLGSHTPSS
jgi:predicted enzyme related to lactoylglutathione lyase